MKLKTKKIITIIFALFFVQKGFSQVVEKMTLDSLGRPIHKSHILKAGNIGADPTPNHFIAPRLNVKTVKMNANIAGHWWDFYLYNTIPTLTNRSMDTTMLFTNDLLNQTGGLLNIALSHINYFANGHDKLNKDIKGAQFDFRTGAKVINPMNQHEQFVPVIQTSFDLRYNIPLVKDGTRNDLRNDMMGNLSFRFYTTLLNVMSSKTYNNYYKSVEGNPPLHQNILTFNYEINIFIFDEFFLSFGRSFGKSPNFDKINGMIPRTFLSISYLAK